MLENEKEYFKKLEPEKGYKRKFNKSKSDGNLQQISKNTILGVLYRLIGDQRTLHQIKKSDNHYFSDIEDNIDFETDKSFSYEELVMLINKGNDKVGMGKYIGVPRDDAKLFFSENSTKLWSVLYLDIDKIMSFISSSKINESIIGTSSLPRDLLERINVIDTSEPLKVKERLISEVKSKIEKANISLKEFEHELTGLSETDEKVIQSKNKQIDNKKINISNLKDEMLQIEHDKSLGDLTEMINTSLVILKKEFPEIYATKKNNGEGYIKNGQVFQMSFYAAALYLQIKRMKQARINIEPLLSKSGLIQGFSKRKFNSVRDFLNLLSTGGDKKTVKTPFTITKTSGKLEINIDINRDRAKKIRGMIEDAGVSSFYLGKKGLAYMSQEIDTRELRR
ncbi:MAG: hypothetical protein HFP81_05545 [Methylococcales symbiont of Hymedesmia sp. n. MRB-2018]|nr:MAG: hypothetical protein HFP81_05545 [Methylococcales symbiont of Hymedesmia sp. n. MRB-2018]